MDYERRPLSLSFLHAQNLAGKLVSEKNFPNLVDKVE